MAALSPGQLLEGTSYQVVREIGAGGMGIVYEVEHIRLKKRYVAKTVHDLVDNEANATKRMEREAQVLASIEHPNIVQVHDFGTTSDGVTYFIMDKLQGLDLRRAMRTQFISRMRAVEIMIDVLDALEHVHRLGVVHRDIKPDNIFLAEVPGTSGAPRTVTKVLDFGIARLLERSSTSQDRLTKTGGFVGTLYYAAPEQMQGLPAAPSNDVYGVGLVLFELFAKRGPFDGDPGVGLLRCFQGAPRLDTFTRAPADLCDIVARALDGDPTRRPSASAFGSELRRILERLKTTPKSEEDAEEEEIDELLLGIGRRNALEAGLPLPVWRSDGARRASVERSDAMAVAVATTAPPVTPLMDATEVSAVPGHADQPSTKPLSNISPAKHPVESVPHAMPPRGHAAPHAMAISGSAGVGGPPMPAAVRFDSVPRASARAGPASGRYGSVDGVQLSGAAQATARRGIIALAASSIVALGIVLTALVYRSYANERAEKERLQGASAPQATGSASASSSTADSAGIPSSAASASSAAGASSASDSPSASSRVGSAGPVGAASAISVATEPVAAPAVVNPSMPSTRGTSGEHKDVGTTANAGRGSARAASPKTSNAQRAEATAKPAIKDDDWLRDL